MPRLGVYRKVNPTVGFSKYEFKNKLLVGVTFCEVTLEVTSTEPNISYFNVNFDKSTFKLHCHLIF